MTWTNTKSAITATAAIILAATVAITLFHPHRLKLNPQLKSFARAKEAQASAAFKVDGRELPPDFKSYFEAANRGDWLTVSNTFREFSQHASQYQHAGPDDLRLRGTAWEDVKEDWGGLHELAVGVPKYSTAYGNDIIRSIPPGSIYFGGTDSGRFSITAMEKSQADGDPFFILTQNALADNSYLDYLRRMYGDKIYIPSRDDSEKCFDDYKADAVERKAENKLKPGEKIKVGADGKVQINGMMSVMAINGLLAKMIFDKNTTREFYLEESFPLDWTYPCLEPHGLILKINRQPLASLPDETVNQDCDYWTHYIQPMIGDWLNEETPVKDVAEFTNKVYRKHDYAGFKGDKELAQNNYTRRIFSKLRASQADVYVWRMNQANDDAERDRMARAADFAYREAMALCPSLPEVVQGYGSFLKTQNRKNDASVVTAAGRRG